MQPMKPNLSSAPSCVRWGLIHAQAADELVTVRDIKRLVRPRGSVPNEVMDQVLQELIEEGEVRVFKSGPRRGRPSTYLHPYVQYRILLTPDGLEPEPTPLLAPTASVYDGLEEVPRKELIPAPFEDFEEDSDEPVPAPASPPEQPQVQPQEPEPTTPVVDATPAEPAPPAPEPGPAQVQQQEPAKTKQDPLAAMRALAAKSVADRGHGVTRDELHWVLVKLGHGAEEAEALVDGFTGGGPEHWMVGGLVETHPASPRNRTEQVRYIPRTDAQAKDPELAAFEAQRRQTAPA